MLVGSDFRGLAATGHREVTWRGLSHRGHLPAKFSVRMANMRSTEPRMARCTMTGRS